MTSKSNPSECDLVTNLGVDVVAATLLDEYSYGRGRLWKPVYLHHHTPRRCPFCGEGYYVHAGVAGHRDRCDDGPIPGANSLGHAAGGDDG